MRYFLLFLIALSGRNLFSQSVKQGESQLFWKITGKNLKTPSYLFGTIHLNNPELFNFPDSLYIAFQQTKYFTPEVNIYDLFGINFGKLNNNLLINNSGRIYTPTRYINTTSYGSALGWPQFVDAYLNQIAENSGKKVIPLETVDEQKNAINSIVYYDYTHPTLSDSDLIDSYLKGDILKISQITHDNLTGSNGYKEIIINRNLKMVDKIDSILKIGSTFVAVGAAHLGGSLGLVSLLEKKGYTLSVVSSTYTNTKSEAKRYFKSNHSYEYVDSVLNFEMKFGFKPSITINDSTTTLQSRDLGQGNYYELEIEKVPENAKTSYYLDENFYQPQNAKLHTLLIYKTIQAYQGIIDISEIGLCYRRIFIKDGYLYKLTCSGDLPFLISNRPEEFLNRLVFF